MTKLNVGDVITISVNLYRDNFKKYFKLSLIAHLWLLIPLYGWGKYFETAFNISYLSVAELLPASQKKKQLQKLANWNWLRHLLAFVIVSIISVVVGIGIIAILFLLLVLLVFLESLIFNFSSDNISGNDFINFTIGLAFLFAIALSLLYPYSRLFLGNLISQQESKNNIFYGLMKSYKLTKLFNLKIFAIIVLSFLLLIPFLNISYFFTALFLGLINGISQVLFTTNLESNDLILPFLLTWFFFINFMTMPFWQSIKAVVYYKLLCDREGFDLELDRHTA